LHVCRYTRDPNQQKNMQDEIQAVKAREEQVMMEVRQAGPGRHELAPGRYVWASTQGYLQG
jgi:hypothetical protein